MWDQALAGNYTVNMALSLYRQPEFLGPHLRLTQTALWTGSGVLLFRINVTNDGNKTLSPVELADMLSDSLSFVNSTLRPVVSGRNVSWSLPFLPVGQTHTIDLFASFEGEPSPFSNSIVARGHYEREWVQAKASCSQPEPCCGPKAGPVKASDLGESHETPSAVGAEISKSCLLEGVASSPSFIEEAAEAEAEQMLNEKKFDSYKMGKQGGTSG